MVEKKKPITWKDLLERISRIPEHQLSDHIPWWGDEKGGVIYEIYDLEDDYYRTDEGYAPRSSFSDSDFEDYIDGKEDFIPKGCPVLMVD